jgi:phosphoglycerol transferase MdoB-like AlkP superfamily enzyme
MIEYFLLEDLQKAKVQRKKTILIYLSTLVVFFAYLIAMLLWYWTLPYKHPQISLIKWLLYPTGVAYMVFSYVYLSICYGRVNRYYKLCDKVLYDKKETYEGQFLRYDDSLDFKDRVDCKNLIFKEW